MQDGHALKQQGFPEAEATYRRWLELDNASSDKDLRLVLNLQCPSEDFLIPENHL